MKIVDWFNVVAGSLGPNAAVAQFIAYTCLTITSVIVASVSLRFSYRQNSGWRPILLVASHGIKGSGGEEGKIELIVIFEVWNRRTYPIVIEYAEVKFDQKDLIDSFAKRTNKDKPWHINRSGRCFSQERVVIKNGEHSSFELLAPIIKGHSLDIVDSDVYISINYFDPRRSRVKRPRQKYIFNFKSREVLRNLVHRWFRKRFNFK